MHTQIEQYLEEVETRLVDLPVAQRESEVEEIRQHMEASITAFVQQGYSPEEGVTRTLEQFGKAQTVGAELANAHDRKLRTRWDNVPMAAVVFVTARWLLHTVRGLLSPNLYALSMPVSGSLYYMAPAVLVSGMWFILLMAFASGWLTAQIAPRRAITGIALWHIIMFIVSMCGFLILLPQFETYIPAPAISRDQLIHSFSVSRLRDFLVYMPIAMLGAHLGRIWKQKRRRRMAMAN